MDERRDRAGEIAMPAAESNTFWQGRPVFVTGATGLLGSWVAAVLVARGAVVTALVPRRRAGQPAVVCGRR